MRLELGYISRYRDGQDIEPDDEALIFIEEVEPDEEGNASIHIRCKNAKTVAAKLIAALRNG